MKDILRFAGSTLLMQITLIMINMVFVQTLAGDSDLFNMVLLVIFTLVVLASAVYEGVNRGAKDCKYSKMMERQQAERGYVVSDKEKEKFFKPSKGIAAGMIASAPAIVLSLISMIVNSNDAIWLAFATRISLGEYLGLFSYTEDLVPWIYLPLSLIYPAVMGVAYTFGPKLWARQQEQMEKAKREKRRKVNRRRKKKKTA